MSSVATRPALLVASLVTEGHNYQYFVTQFYLGCEIHQTNLATLRADPTPVLPCLTYPEQGRGGLFWPLFFFLDTLTTLRKLAKIHVR